MLPGMDAITLDVGLALDAVASIIGTVLAVGIALAALILRGTSRVDAEDRRAFQAEAAADRCAWRASMDDFRAAMQRLAERPAHIEGRAAA